MFCSETFVSTRNSHSRPPSDSLARSSHTLAVINNDLYIYGGLVSHTTLTTNEIHVIKLSNLSQETLGSQYAAIPAITRDGDDIPLPRAAHTANTHENRMVVFGGFNDPQSQTPIDDKGRVWLFDPATSHWTHLDPVSERYPTRAYHAAAIHGRKLIVHGGYSASPSSDPTSPETDTWSFDLTARVWIKLPDLPSDTEGKAPMLASAPPNLAVADDSLYLVAGSSDLGSQIYILNLAAEVPDSWTTLEFPTNPLTPGPRPRKGAGLVPVKTGLGRTYLLLMLGEKEESASAAGLEKQTPGKSSGGRGRASSEAEFWSGLWVLQLPSRDDTPAQLKDKTREKIPRYDSHEAEWSECELVVTDAGGEDEGGKSHPGPRGYFGCSALDGKSKVVLWGGINPRGEYVGDGWIVDLGV